MPQPFVGEIRMFAGNFAPAGWMFCEGQQLAISEYETLYQLIGDTYGGDGQLVFQLPDLRGRIPIHQGPGFPMASAGGAEEVTLTVDQIPAHSHAFETAGVRGNQISPAGNLPAESYNVVPYINDATTGSFDTAAISYSGGSRSHANFQSYLCVNHIISLFGIFPPPA
jgi:microcystin-dependent protein